jgi:RNA polymerase sigma-70 factor (ECF subfamily)
LVDDHGATLFRVAFRLVGNRHEAEDLVQETFRSAWNSRALFEKGRGDRAWLVTILRRRAADFWRKPALPITAEQPPETMVHDADPLAKEYTDEMQLALESLTFELRESLLLVVVADLTHQETANLLGVPIGTVLSRVSRARERLRTALLAQSRSGGHSRERQ